MTGFYEAQQHGARFYTISLHQLLETAVLCPCSYLERGEPGAAVECRRLAARRRGDGGRGRAARRRRTGRVGAVQRLVEAAVAHLAPK